MLQVQGRANDARLRYEKALALNPRAAVAANNLAWVHAENGDLDRALELAKTAKAELPDTAAVDDTLGWVYHKNNLNTLAIGSLKAAVTKEPTNPVYHYHLGAAYAAAQDADAARQSLQRAVSLKLPQTELAEANKLLAELLQ